MIPSPDLSAALGRADRIVSAFHADPTPGAVSRSLAHLRSLTSPEAVRAIDSTTGRTQPDGARLLAHLAFWADYRAAGGEALLTALRYSESPSTVHLPSGPAGVLAAQLMAELDGPRRLREAEELLSMATARERQSQEGLASAGRIRSGTRVRYRLSMPEGARRTFEVFPSASAAWQHFLHHDTPGHPIGIAAETAGGQDRELSPADLRADAVAEPAASDSTVREIHSRLLRAAEVAWLHHRLSGPARYPDADRAVSAAHRLTERRRADAEVWASATLESAVRLDDPALVDRAADILTAEEQRPLRRELWREAFLHTAQQALAATRLPLRERNRLDTEELSTYWQILRLVRADDPRLGAAADHMLTELSARDPQAQRLRAVLEPVMADSARDWATDASSPRGSARQQTAEAFQTARAYTAARILHRSAAWDGKDHIDVMYDALRAAGIDDAVAIAAGLVAAPAPSARTGPLDVDAYAESWMAAHPDARRALEAENKAVALAAEAGALEGTPGASAKAVYRQLRADRMAAAYSALGRLTSPMTAPAGPYTTVAAQAHADTLRQVVVTTFGSAERAADFLADRTAHLERIEGGQSATPAAPVVQTRGPQENGTVGQAASLQLAAAELGRLFPELVARNTDSAPPSRMDALTGRLAADAAARRQLVAVARRPHSHDHAQQAAQAGSRPGLAGPTRK